MKRAKREFAGKIIDFRQDHLPGIIDLWVASWALTLPQIDFEARRPWLADHLKDLTARGVAIRTAIASDGRIAGFVTIDAANGHLDQICVAHAWWGHGVAEALLDAARAISSTGLHLDVNADNPRAVAFYIREGFVETGRSTSPRSGLPIIRMETTAT